MSTGAVKLTYDEESLWTSAGASLALPPEKSATPAAATLSNIERHERNRFDVFFGDQVIVRVGPTSPASLEPYSPDLSFTSEGHLVEIKQFRTLGRPNPLRVLYDPVGELLESTTELIAHREPSRGYGIQVRSWLASAFAGAIEGILELRGSGFRAIAANAASALDSLSMSVWRRSRESARTRTPNGSDAEIRRARLRRDAAIDADLDLEREARWFARDDET
jgi:hypothetical protein